MIPLPGLVRPEHWLTDSTSVVQVAEAASNLIVRFRYEPDQVADLRLREPVGVPDACDDLTFLGNNNSIPNSIRLQAIVRDATGQEFFFYTLAALHDPKSSVQGTYLAGHHRARELRFRVPGLSRPVIEGRSSATIMPPKPGVQPRRPYAWLGLRLIGQTTQPGATPEFYFRDFRFTHLTPDTSAFYYHFDGQEHFGEVEPFPRVTPGMVRWFGKRFEIGWDVRDAYAGQPFLSGGQVFHLPFMSHYDQTHGIPYYLRLAAPVTIPFTERGTYWVRVRYRWSKEDKSPLPDMVEEREYRLFIYRGAAPRPHAPLPADAALSHTTIRIAADRPSLIYGPRERLAVKVAFWPPPAGVTNAFFHVEARSASDGETVKRVEGTPQWVTSRPFVAELDLSDQPAGPYRIRATMRSGDRVFDELERLVGRQGPPPPALTVRRRGAVPSYQELLGRPAKAVDAPCTAEPQSALRKGVPPHDPAAAHPTDARDPGPCALPGRRGRPLARRPCCGRAGAHPARRQDGRTARH